MIRIDITLNAANIYWKNGYYMRNWWICGILIKSNGKKEDGLSFEGMELLFMG